jgi:hypothetical protein
MTPRQSVIRGFDQGRLLLGSLYPTVGVAVPLRSHILSFYFILYYPDLRLAPRTLQGSCQAANGEATAANRAGRGLPLEKAGPVQCRRAAVHGWMTKLCGLSAVGRSHGRPPDRLS